MACSCDHGVLVIPSRYKGFESGRWNCSLPHLYLWAQRLPFTISSEHLSYITNHFWSKIPCRLAFCESQTINVSPHFGFVNNFSILMPILVPEIIFEASCIQLFQSIFTVDHRYDMELLGWLTFSMDIMKIPVQQAQLIINLEPRYHPSTKRPTFSYPCRKSNIFGVASWSKINNTVFAEDQVV